MRLDFTIPSHLDINALRIVLSMVDFLGAHELIISWRHNIVSRRDVVRNCDHSMTISVDELIGGIISFRFAWPGTVVDQA